MKNDTEEQAEILDLDSHKVQTHRYEDEYNMRMHQHAEMHHHMQIQQHHHQMQHHQSQSPVHSVNTLSRSHTMAQPYDYHQSMSSMVPVDNVVSMQDQQSQFMLGQLPLAGVEPPHHPGSPIISSTQPMPSHQLHQPPSGLMPAQNPKPPTMGNQSWKSNEARRPKTYNCTACNKWFTSSGHLKRHYNTTLHKNAVKQSNQPDPANMPISAHHHPGRDTTAGSRSTSGSSGGPTNRTSPELSSSSSPPNLMAGPSGEATRGLLHTPTTNTSSAHIYNNNNHISSSNSNNEATPLPALQEQKFLQQQIHQQQLHHHQRQQQPQSSGIVIASELYQNTTGPTSMINLHSHHQAPQLQHLHHQPMGSSSPLQPQQQQSQQSVQSHQTHHLQMDSPHQTMSSPMSPMQQHPSHMSSPSPMSTGSQQQPPAHLGQQQQQQQPPPLPSHHMDSPSPTMVGALPLGHQAISSRPTVTMMGDTSMPHQPYPNALPPHVTTITNIQVLLKSITSPLTTTGNDKLHHDHQQQQHAHALPAFNTFTSHHQHQHEQHQQDSEIKQSLPSFTQFEYVVAQHPAVSRHTNVGGLSPEEAHAPSHIKFEAIDSYENYENYENYRSSSPRYECFKSNGNEVNMMQVPADSSTTTSRVYTHLQQRQELHHNHLHHHRLHDQHHQQETNNNSLLHPAIKEELNPNISDAQSLCKKSARAFKAAKSIKIETKEHQVTSTNMGSHYISENGLHKCIECDKVFNRACYLTQHNKSFHSGDKPFKCNQCGKRFPHEYQHAEHLQKHAGDKPYKCEVCPKQFNHKTDLRRHMCLHTGEKPYACDNCGKGFIRKDHMMKHVETHKKKNNLHKIHLRA